MVENSESFLRSFEAVVKYSLLISPEFTALFLLIFMESDLWFLPITISFVCSLQNFLHHFCNMVFSTKNSLSAWMKN